jgi:hypothetical protein
MMIMNRRGRSSLPQARLEPMVSASERSRLTPQNAWLTSFISSVYFTMLSQWLDYVASRVCLLIELFCVVTPCCGVHGYQSSLKIPYPGSRLFWRRTRCVSPKRQYPPKGLHVVKIQKSTSSLPCAPQITVCFFLPISVSFNGGSINENIRSWQYI